MPRQQHEKCVRGLGLVGGYVIALVAFACLLAACGKAPVEATAVADQFIRAYFVEDSMAGAVKLASGSARTRLEGLLSQIQAAGANEPVKEKPRVKVTLVETQPVAAEAVGYVYRIDSETPGIAPITAKLRLSKEGNSWTVSEFDQTP